MEINWIIFVTFLKGLRITSIINLKTIKMLIDEVKALIAELKKENSKRTEKLNEPGISEYNNSFYVHTYNNTLEIIKKLENIVI